MYCWNSLYWLALHLIGSIGLLLLETSISALGAAAAPEITGNPRVVVAKSTPKQSEAVTITLGAASAYSATAVCNTFINPDCSCSMKNPDYLPALIKLLISSLIIEATGSTYGRHNSFCFRRSHFQQRR